LVAAAKAIKRGAKLTRHQYRSVKAEEAPKMNTPPMHTDHLVIRKFTQQSCRRVRSPSARSTPQRTAHAGLSTATSLACFVEFRDARERLLAQFEPAAPTLAPAPKARQTAGHGARYTGCAHPLKTSLAWLLSAAALGGVLLGILSR
jgi:hypothetical protein